MTVGELIEELQKHPAHYIAMMTVPTQNMESGCLDEDWHQIGGIEMESNCGDIGCVVKVMA